MKMKRNISFMLSAALITAFTFAANANETASQAELEKQASGIVQQFASTLKPKLVNAIQTGGFEHAIEICATEAPLIADQLSADTGWQVKRVSLKPRNKSSATADSFEQATLQQFEQRQAQGEPATTISFSEITGDTFRFMKAQGVEGLCLSCHGQAIAPDVAKAINAHYPEDVATGYTLGQIRGAFSLQKKL
jgi:hypothetical protein